MDSETLRRLLECPICFRPPRGLQVLTCTEGHWLCSACFERLPKRVCPQGRCQYAVPPLRNRAVEALMEEADFRMPCRHADDGCDFEGGRAELGKHELKCGQGRIPCIEGGTCRARLQLDGMASHLRASHPSVVFLESNEGSTSSSSSTQKWLLKTKTHLTKPSCCWNTVVWDVRGHTMAIRFVKRDHVWFTFVVVFADEEVAEKLSCEVTVAGRSEYHHVGRVHSARADLDSIVSSATPSCLALPNDVVADLVSATGISQASLKAGFDGQLSVCYCIRADGDDAKGGKQGGKKRGNNRRTSNFAGATATRK